MFVVDTNVLVYAADRDAPGHERCRDLLIHARPSSRPLDRIAEGHDVPDVVAARSLLGVFS